MGVINDNLAVTGYKFTGSVERIGNPDDYFCKIGLDQLQLYSVGGWMSKDGPEFLLELRTTSERLYELERRHARFTSHDGIELEVYPHGARPGYQILIRDGDGFELRALPKKKGMPDVFLRFGARWCNERIREQIEAWSYGILCHIGYDAEDIMVSQLHLRVDVPTSFSKKEIELISGTGTRNTKVTTTYDPTKPDEFEDFSNRGGAKKIVFDIYDKREEQKNSNSPFWPLVWASFGIDPHQLIWRCEARWGRKSLLAFGIDTIQDLTDEVIRELWYDFSHKYVYLTDDPSERSDRARIIQKWQQIATCGKPFKPKKVRAKIDVADIQLLKQAAGCIARAVAAFGLKGQKSRIRRMIVRVVDAGIEKYEEKRETYAGEMIKKVLAAQKVDASAEKKRLIKMLKEDVGLALKKMVGAASYKDASGGGV